MNQPNSTVELCYVCPLGLSGSPNSYFKKYFYIITGKVAFSAWLSKELNDTKANETVVFDIVHTNIGSAYSSTTGIFTTPFNGVYGFTWTLMTNPGKLFDTVLVVDGEGRQSNGANSGNVGKSYESSTNMITMQLTKGQQVWIRKHIDGNLLRSHFSTFSGWLIE